MTRVATLAVAFLLPGLALAAAPHPDTKAQGSSLRAPPVQAARRSGQGAGERVAQADLPQSKAPIWTVLRRTRIGEDSAKGVFTATFPPEVRAMDKRSVALTGFMLPLDVETRSKHFLLSKYTPVCFFCPPGEPNEVVEVFSRSGLPVTDRMVQVSGRFGLENNGDRGLFFRVDDAQVK